MGFQTAVSGLNSVQKAQAQTMYNIANAKTAGFKAGEAVFHNVMAGSGSAAGGVSCSIITDVANQGVMEDSTANTDMSISGNGFFVTSAQEKTMDIRYTRSGSCRTNKNGDLVTSTGEYLLGFVDIDDNGDPLSSVNPSDISSLAHINVNKVVGIAKATENMSLNVNLPSGDSVGAQRVAIVKMYDALGARHDLEMTFTKLAITPASWQLDITSKDGTILRNDTGNAYSVVVSFDGQGRPTDYGGFATPPKICCQWTDAVTNAQDTQINFSLGSVNTLEGITSRAGEFSPSSQQDGREFGTYRSVSIDTDGKVSAVYSNGQTLVIGRIVLANFAAPDKLEPLSGSSWIETDLSGGYVLSLPNRGGIGKIISNSLETSTVNIAASLTDLIEENNLYAANTKSIQADKANLEALLRIS